VTGVLGGLVAALMWGTSTAIASRSTRMIGSQQVLAYVVLTGLVIMVVAAPVVEGVPDVTARGAAWALAAGAASVIGLGCVYAALRIGKVGVVAPIASCEGALAAVFSVIFLGEQLSLGVALALAVVACGVVLVTFHAHLSDVHLRPALLAGTSAIIFGFGLVASSQAGGAIGPYWTILVSRVVGVVFVVVPMVVTGQLRPPGRRALPLVVYSGVAEVIGFVGYITGSQHGVAVPAVLASQFAAVAAFVSFLFFGERLSRMQVYGAVLIAIGVATVAVLRVWRIRQAGVSQPLSSSSSLRRGTAPISFFLTSPPSNTISVGIDSTCSRPAVSWFSSTFSFTNATRPPCCSASSSRIGSITRQGVHQGAQKSTTTGRPASSTSLRNVLSETSTM
jgi:uncharacterized membrane protein